MLRRILFTTAAAATLLAASPAFAAEHADAKHQQCSCGSDGSMHRGHHAVRETNRAPTARAGLAAASSDPFLQNQGSDDAFIRNNSFGG